MSQTAGTKPTATPALDGASRTYLDMLRAYYVPWAQDYIQEGDLCSLPFGSLPGEKQSQQLPACRPLLVPEIAAGKTLISQLATAQPPARWQTEHAALTQAMQAADAFDAQRLLAIDAASVSQYLVVVHGAPDVMMQFCEPITTFDRVLVASGASLLPAPASAACLNS